MTNSDPFPYEIFGILVLLKFIHCFDLWWLKDEFLVYYICVVWYQPFTRQNSAICCISYTLKRFGWFCGLKKHDFCTLKYLKMLMIQNDEFRLSRYVYTSAGSGLHFHIFCTTVLCVMANHSKSLDKKNTTNHSN